MYWQKWKRIDFLGGDCIYFQFFANHEFIELIYAYYNLHFTITFETYP